MLFKETGLPGAYIIEVERKGDKRGFFARSYCRQEFKDAGIDFSLVQSSISYNKIKGTLRGMHYQIAPYEEAKIVSCIKGVIWDVIIDLRIGSPTYCKWFAAELSFSKYNSLYVPKGFAHGFQTLENDTTVFYQISEFYHSESARGVRWNDPVFKIEWPEIRKRIISDKDSKYPDFIL